MTEISSVEAECEVPADLVFWADPGMIVDTAAQQNVPSSGVPLSHASECIVG